MEELCICHLSGMSIYEQLLLEERLLRHTDRNYCLFNHQIEEAAIVLGVSGKRASTVDLQVQRSMTQIPLIKRYSGGGTVVVDQDTLFVSFILCKSGIGSHVADSEMIFHWSETLYQQAFPQLDFSLREHDYVIADKKCGGNAQYLQKKRFAHHTTFLWDYQPELMKLLLYPPKSPSYRRERDHIDFLSRLSDYLPTTTTFFESVTHTLADQFDLRHLSFDTLKQRLIEPLARQTTCYLSPHRDSAQAF